jgi:hypothetical protein
VMPVMPMAKCINMRTQPSRVSENTKADTNTE